MTTQSNLTLLILASAVATVCDAPALAQTNTPRPRRPQHTWSLSIDQPDDTMKTYVNGSLVSTCTFGSTCDINLSDYFVSGKNTVKLELMNTDAGWTYSYTFYEDGSPVMSASCGTFNVTGCMGDEYTERKVYSVSVVITN